MSVSAPPRPPRPSDPVERDEIEALVEALIEEARQRARRRRQASTPLPRCSWPSSALGVFTLSSAAHGVADCFSRARRAVEPCRRSGTNSKIAFISAPQAVAVSESTAGSTSMNVDGSGKQQPDVPPRYSTPAWSPDGRRIAFGAGSNVCVMNADGSGQRSLTPDPGDGLRSCLVARRAEDRLRRVATARGRSTS